MGRALLRRNSIIVLDEATTSIDFVTDAKIQSTIREQFNDPLLLTGTVSIYEAPADQSGVSEAAHRLRTVMDYGRLIILDNGRMTEVDTIQKEGGIFRHMCLKSVTFSELGSIARAKVEQGH